MPSIQVVDIAAISLANTAPPEEDYKALAGVLESCFKDIGFVFIKNHGIDQAVITEAMQASMEFFNLERDVKSVSRKGAEYQGWVEQGREIFDQDEDGKIAELEVRETYDMKNISSSGKFPDKNCTRTQGSLDRVGRNGN
eukprot:TRINITY_DN2212_c0_g1_i4.p1 TRINITY_DN2212_c0_g1~~TRINITY_DN2212_c0_g1_i4.p1  ORF type:complete len:140 (-),score=49.59 TRINITY_DN2212_c0_g1_i4:1-420(-)